MRPSMQRFVITALLLGGGVAPALHGCTPREVGAHGVLRGSVVSIPYLDVPDFDLDGLDIVIVDGVPMFLHNGFLYERMTGRIRRRSDDDVGRWVIEPNLGAPAPPRTSPTGHRLDMVTALSVHHIEPSAMAPFLPGRLVLTVDTMSNWTIPQLDDRYPGLDRRMWIRPDGHVGTPDALTWRLDGPMPSVMAYLADAGARELAISIGGAAWRFVLGVSGDSVEVHRDGELVGHVALPSI